MAKRKRLTPPDPALLNAASGPFSAPVRQAPISDVARDASATAALDELSQAMNDARLEGRLVMSLALEQLDLTHLVRDRVALDEAEMQELMQSLKARGQQTPIEITDLGDGRFGLISGLRRCQALSRLYEETGDERFGRVLALLRNPKQATDAYLAMIEENEIRAALSFYERARIVAKSVEQGVYESHRAALRGLFANVSRSKRSKIGSFIRVVEALDGTLRFPQAISERLGLALSKALDSGALSAKTARATLKKADPQTADAEQTCLKFLLNEQAERPVNSPADTDRPTVDKWQVSEGLWLSQPRSGVLVISGDCVTDQLRDELENWLSKR